MVELLKMTFFLPVQVMFYSSVFLLHCVAAVSDHSLNNRKYMDDDVLMNDSQGKLQKS